MSVEQITVILGTALSLLVAYVPGFNAWFDALASQSKALFMLAGAFVWVALVFAVSCAGYSPYGVVCTLTDAVSLLQLVIAFAIANQATYFLAVRPYKSK